MEEEKDENYAKNTRIRVLNAYPHFNSERNAKSFRRKCSKPSFSTKNNKENCQNT